MDDPSRSSPLVRPGVAVPLALLLSIFALLAATGTEASTGESEPTRDEPKLDDITLRLEESGEGWRLLAENLRPVAVEVLVRRRDDQSLVDASVLPPEETEIVLEWPGLGRQEVLTILEQELQVGSVLGDPASIDPDEDHLYRLPFRAGRRYRLVQGFHGKRSHRNETSRYALDFEMPVGEPVHAARAGRVVKVVDGFREGGRDPRLLGRDNRIIVEHGDGTLATYAHLAADGALVEEGDEVERGQHLGFSGRTGYTSGPHLHFVVRGARDVSIPIRFEGYEERDLRRSGRMFRLDHRD